MKKICLQAGHENTSQNSIEVLRRSTGAPNEMSFNVDIRNQVAGELRKRGFNVTTTDANANNDPDITERDFDLFLSIHYDADIYNRGGGFIDFPDPSTDHASSESQRLQRILSEEYFKKTGIVRHQERSNPNTKFYYMWKYLSAKTPCNLIECGVGMHSPDDHTLLHFNRPLVVEGIVRGICEAFDVEYDQAQAQDPCTELRKENGKLRAEIVKQKTLNVKLKEMLEDDTALVKKAVTILKPIYE